MKVLLKEIFYLLAWVVSGLLLVPGIVWLSREHILALVTDLPSISLTAVYQHMYSGLTGPAGWSWIVVPYLLFLLVRGRRKRRHPGGSTSMGRAAFAGDTLSIQALIDQGMDINRKDASGRTPLHIAALQDRVDVVRQLFEAGVDIDATDTQSGYSPLHVAAMQGHAGVSEILVKYGADIDMQSQPGATPLHLAVVEGHLPVVAILLKYRARLDIRDSNGQTPLQCADARGHEKIAALIRQHATEEWPYLKLSSG